MLCLLWSFICSFRLGYQDLLKITFLIKYLAAYRPTLDQRRGGSLIHLMLIAGLFQVRPDGQLEPCNEVGSQDPAERISGIESETFRFSV